MSETYQYHEVAFCRELKKLKPQSNYNLTSPEIMVQIATLRVRPAKDGVEGVEDIMGFSVSYDTPKTSVGGCFSRIFPSSHGDGVDANLFNHYGPNISYGDVRQYEHAARAMGSITMRMKVMSDKRGYADNAADRMSRWLEATRVKEVYLMRAPYDEMGKYHGDNEILTVGEFVNRVRQNLYVAPAAVAV